MHWHDRPLISSKNETLLRQGVCVCPICKDVKLRHVNLFMQGARNPWLSVLANEDQTAWGWKRTCDFLNCWTSCRIHYFAIIACEWRGAKPSTPTPWFYFSTVATICIFAETMSPTVFVIISPSHVADCILIILPCHVADVLLESGLNSVGQYWMFYFGFEKYYKSL